MLPRGPRERVLFHLLTALGVVLVSALLACGALGSYPVADQVFESAVEPRTGETPGLASAVAEARPEDPPRSSRGGRSWEPPAIPTRGEEAARPSASPTGSLQPPAADTPRPTATRAVQPTATPVPLPTSTASPAPTVAPKPTTAPSPAAAATSAPRFRVGIQAGHWKNSELPGEMASLRGSTGAQGNGWKEMEINLDIAKRVVALLEREGIQVDLIPATVPSSYKADAFVSLHGDANSNTALSGYKLARARWSKIPPRDDALLADLSSEYRAVTGLPEHRGTITNAMLAYYAFNWQILNHAVAPTTPAVILEMGFLTTLADRKLLMEQPDRAAQGVTKGVLKFLKR